MSVETTKNGCFRGGTTYEDVEREIHAFPIVVPHDFRFAADGMSLRDYFAGQAIGTCVDNFGFYGKAAENAYEVADEMMKARESKPVQE